MNKAGVIKWLLHDRFLAWKLRSREQLEAYQQHRIQLFLRWLCAHSPFYAPYAGKPLSAFPVMNKHIMQEHFSTLNTVGLEKEKAFAFAHEAQTAKQFSHNYGTVTLGLSSGTTGSPSLFVASARERAQWAGIMLSKALRHVPCKRHRVAFCFRNNSTLYETVHSPLMRLHFLDTVCDIAALATQVRHCNPTILIAPAQVLRLLCSVLPAGAVAPDRVFSIGEVLEPEAEQAISTFFNQRVFQIYQCTEGFLGISHPDFPGVMLNEEYVFFEREWIDSTRFIPVITDFTRTSQPIVRYRHTDILQVDTGTPVSAPCTCLNAIEGRLDDVVFLCARDGTQEPVFADTLRVLMSTVSLENYRIEQNSPGSLLFLLQPHSQENEVAVLHRMESLCMQKKFRLPEVQFAPLPQQDPQKKFRRITRNCLIPGDKA